MDEHAPKRQLAGLYWHRTVCLAVLLTLSYARAATASPVSFDVPEGDASKTLNLFCTQANLQLLFDYTKAKGIHTRAVRGRYTVGDALQRMIGGAPLHYTIVNEHTLAITVETQQQRLAEHARRRGAHVRSPAASGVLEEVDVTADSGQAFGAPVDPAMEALTFSRTDIEQSGAATLEDFLGTQPQVFGGGPTQRTELGREAATNDAHGSGVNVRGMDAGATVVLLDGQRLAPSGTDGGWVDVSLIPLGAVERVTLIPNAATAEYGSDALGGVVDVKLRSDFSGSETAVRVGSTTDRGPSERDINQLLGIRWTDGGGLLALEYYSRDALPAADRWQATSDLQPFGGSNFDVVGGNPGTIVEGGTTWAIPHGQDGRSLSSASLVAGTDNRSDLWQGATVLPQERRLSAFTNAKQVLSESATLAIDAVFADRKTQAQEAPYRTTLPVPPSNPYYVNPTGSPGPAAVLYGFGADFGPLITTADERAGSFQTGLNWQASERWQVRGTLGYSFEHDSQTIRGYANPTALATALADSSPATAFNPFGDGSHTDLATLDSIRAQTHFDSSSMLALASVRAEGGLATFPTGDLVLRTGLDYRDQRLDTNAVPIPPTAPLSNSLGRQIAGGFVELRIPLVDSLELSTAIRDDHYSDIGNAVAPQLGLSWLPLPSIALRGTWTRAFRPPNLPDRVEATNQSGLLVLPDASSPTGSAVALIWTGKNADLRPERAMTWTLGADMTPESLPGLLLSLTYFSTVVKDRIEQGLFSPDVLDDPTDAALVIRNPTDAQRAAACSRRAFQGLASTCLTAPIGALVDLRLHNAATVQTRGLDLNAQYSTRRWHGELKTALTATYLFAYSRQDLTDGPTLEVLNTPHNPLDLRIRGTLEWSRGRLSVATFLNYSNHYDNPLSQVQRSIASWTTLDGHCSFDFGADAERKGVELAFDVQNLFNKAPPFVDNPVGVGYDQENADLLGRFVSVSLRKRW